MDAKTCIRKLRLIASVSMATVDESENPQVRPIVRESYRIGNGVLNKKRYFIRGNCPASAVDYGKASTE